MIPDNEWGDEDVLSDKASQMLFIAPLIEPNDNPPMHNVSTRLDSAGFGQYLVCLTLGGKQRFLGYKIAEPEIACRFADMACLKFRKYLKRIKWNFSEAQAIADTANDEENGGGLANMLLGRRERLWKLKGITLKEVPQATQAKPKANRRTVESRLASLESRLAALEAQPHVTVPPVLDPIQPATPIFYPTITCTDPAPTPNILTLLPTIWKP